MLETQESMAFSRGAARVNVEHYIAFNKPFDPSIRLFFSKKKIPSALYGKQTWIDATAGLAEEFLVLNGIDSPTELPLWFGLVFWFGGLFF